MAAPKPKVEYRVACACARHRYSYPTLEKALAAAERNNSPATIYAQPMEAFVGSHAACYPWSVEARVVSPWEHWSDAEELASMLVADWWSWETDTHHPLVVDVQTELL